MAREREFEIEEVRNAARKLLADRGRVTPTGLRRIIGHGSPRALMRAWEEDVNLANEDEELPAGIEIASRELHQAIDRAVDTIRHECLSIAYLAMKEETDRLKQELSEFDLLLLEKDRRAEELADLHAAKDTRASERIASLTEEVIAVRGDFAAEREKTARLESALSEQKGALAAATSRIENILTDGATLQEAFHGTETQLAEAKADLTAERHRVMDLTEKLREEAERRCSAEGRLATLGDRIALLDSETQQWRIRAEDSARRVEILLRQLELAKGGNKEVGTNGSRPVSGRKTKPAASPAPKAREPGTSS